MSELILFSCSTTCRFSHRETRGADSFYKKDITSSPVASYFTLRSSLCDAGPTGSAAIVVEVLLELDWAQEDRQGKRRQL
jgi:hypothetical protein